MIDVDDIDTFALPGIPPAPPAPPKTQALRREAMGFQGPRQRVACQYCAHLTLELLGTGSHHESERIRCGKGDFPVQRGAFCNDFVADDFAAAGRRP